MQFGSVKNASIAGLRSVGGSRKKIKTFTRVFIKTFIWLKSYMELLLSLNLQHFVVNLVSLLYCLLMFISLHLSIFATSGGNSWTSASGRSVVLDILTGFSMESNMFLFFFELAFQLPAGLHASSWPSSTLLFIDFYLNQIINCLAVVVSKKRPESPISCSTCTTRLYFKC